MIKVLLIGDESPNVIAHGAIPKALAFAAANLSLQVAHEWVGSEKITSREVLFSRKPDGIWCVPGSPYASMDGALVAIRFAREKSIPFLGTCGGFQHAVIEYARNALRITDADHGESNPEAKTAVIAPLQCPLINKSETLRISPNTRLAAICGIKAKEAYQCSYGLNTAFRRRLETEGLRFCAFNEAEEVRALELKNHPFFIATLFQPERSALSGATHALIVEFARAAQEHQNR